MIKREKNIKLLCMTERRKERKKERKMWKKTIKRMNTLIQRDCEGEKEKNRQNTHKHRLTVSQTD